MFNSYSPFPSAGNDNGSGGAPAGYRVVPELVRFHSPSPWQTGPGWSYVEYRESTTTDPVSLRDLVRNSITLGMDDVEMDEIELEVRCVSGGSGGAWGSNSCYGGFPGTVVTERRPLRYWGGSIDSSIPITIGAGGTPGNWGGMTQFGDNSDPYAISARPRVRGGNNDAEEQMFHGQSGNTGPLTMSRRALAISTDSMYAPHASFGPGGGGSSSSNRPRAGGSSSYRNPQTTVIGPTTPGAAGLDAKDDFYNGWDSFGTGGAGHTTGFGGDGGFPGGGGGASSSQNPTTGGGGNGCVRIRFWVNRLESMT